MSNCLVIIPTYNEKENIKKILDVIFSLSQPFHVLIVDDNSPDGTADIVKSAQNLKYKDKLYLLERKEKLGLGTAYIFGFKWALKKKYDYIFEMDCDFSHNPKDLPKLYSACANDGFDVSVGSRYVSGVNVVNWPMSRVLMSYFASVYVRKILGISIRDTTAGFICYKKKVLETLNLDKIKFKGYCFQIEMKFKTIKLGFKLKEIPVIFTDRQAGKSKMNKKIFKEALFGVIEIKIKSMFSSKFN